MKIAISGKGGAGKTTISATLTRILARRGVPVLAIDGDPNPNLTRALGITESSDAHAIPRTVVERRQDESGVNRHVLTTPVAEIISRYGLRAPDGVTVLVGCRVDHAGAGWLCGAHAAVRSVIGEIINSATDVTIIDMEASIEHMSRGTIRSVDALLVVLEPYYRSLETAGRIVPLARGLGLERIYGIANKLRTPQDEEAVKAYCRNHELELIAAIPFDENVLEADRTGRSVIDHDVTSPIVEELSRVADFLQREVSRNNHEAGGH